MLCLQFDRLLRAYDHDGFEEASGRAANDGAQQHAALLCCSLVSHRRIICETLRRSATLCAAL